MVLMQGDMATNMQSRPGTAYTDGTSRARRVAGWLELVQLACLAWVIWLPVSLGPVLYPALLVVFLSSAGLILIHRTRVSRTAVVVWTVYYAWALAWVVVSAAWGNPGVLHQGVLWLGLPLLWGAWSLTLRGKHARHTILVMLGVGCLTSVLMLWLAADGIWGGPGIPTWLVDLQDMRVVVGGSGEIEQNYLGLSSMVGVGAFAVTAALLPHADDWLPRRRWTVTAAALAFMAAAVSGRRGLLLAILVVVVVATLAGLVRSGVRSLQLAQHAVALAAAAIALVAFVQTPFGVNVDSLVGDASGSVLGASHDSGSQGNAGRAADAEETDAQRELQAESDRLRGAQFHELVGAWQESPVWGRGFGATLDSDFVRSEDRPWMFEAEPLQALMNVGLVGLLIVLGPVSLLLITAWRAVRRRSHARATIAGVAAFCAVALACATNPYLQAPGHGWMLFLGGGLAAGAVRAGAGSGSVDEQRP